MKRLSLIICFLGFCVFMAACQKDTDPFLDKESQPLLEQEPLLKLISYDGYLLDEHFSYLNETNKLKEYSLVSLDYVQKVVISYDVNERITESTYSAYNNGTLVFTFKQVYTTDSEGKIVSLESFLNNVPKQRASFSYNSNGLLEEIKWLKLNNSIAGKVELMYDTNGNAIVETVFNGNDLEPFEVSNFTYDNKNSCYKNSENIEVIYFLLFEYWKYIKPLNACDGRLNELQYLNPTNNVISGIAKWPGAIVGGNAFSYVYGVNDYPEERTIFNELYYISYY